MTVAIVLESVGFISVSTLVGLGRVEGGISGPGETREVDDIEAQDDSEEDDDEDDGGPGCC